jgi:glycerol-3-phosphate dehydrogenase
MTANRIAVLGLGAWGTAVSIMLVRAGHSVTAWTVEEPVAREINEWRSNGKSRCCARWGRASASSFRPKR